MADLDPAALLAAYDAQLRGVVSDPLPAGLRVEEDGPLLRYVGSGHHGGWVDYRDLGGSLLVCGPCINSRGITAADLIEGAEVVAAGRFVAEITSATNSLVY